MPRAQISAGGMASALVSEGEITSELSPPDHLYLEPYKPDKRLNLILSWAVFQDLEAMSKKRRTSMTEIVRLALGLIKVVLFETGQGHKLIVTKANGEVLKELILPG